MPSKIQRIPRGLLSALDATGAGGRYPDVLLDEVRATFDIQFFYDSARQENVIEVVTPVGAVGDGAIITVPPGETWRVIAACSRLEAGQTGVIGSHWVGFTIPPIGSTVVGFQIENPVGAVAGEETVAVARLPAPILLGPGSGIVAQIASTTIALSQITCIATIVRYAL